MKRFFPSRILVFLAFFTLSFVAHAGSPQFVFYKSEEQPLIIDVDAGEESEIDFFVENLDEDRNITMQMSSKALSDSADAKAIPLEWASFASSYVLNLAPGENKPVSLVLDIPGNTEPGIYKISLRGTLINYSGGSSGGGVVMSSAVGIILRVNVVNDDFVYGMTDERSVNGEGGFIAFILLGVFFVSLVALVIVLFMLRKKGKS